MFLFTKSKYAPCHGVHFPPSQILAALKAASAAHKRGNEGLATFYYMLAFRARPKPYRGSHVCGDLDCRWDRHVDSCPACWMTVRREICGEWGWDIESTISIYRAVFKRHHAKAKN